MTFEVYWNLFIASSSMKKGRIRHGKIQGDLTAFFTAKGELSGTLGEMNNISGFQNFKDNTRNTKHSYYSHARSTHVPHSLISNQKPASSRSHPCRHGNHCRTWRDPQHKLTPRMVTSWHSPPGIWWSSSVLGYTCLTPDGEKGRELVSDMKL